MNRREFLILSAFGGGVVADAITGGGLPRGIALIGNALENLRERDHPAVRINKLEAVTEGRPLTSGQIREVIDATAELFTRNFPSKWDSKTIAQNTIVLRGTGNLADQKASVTYPYDVADSYYYSQPYNNEQSATYPTGDQIVVLSDLVNSNESYEEDRRLPLRKFTIKSASDQEDCGKKPTPVSILTTSLLKSMIELQFTDTPYQDLSEEIKAAYEEVSYRLTISDDFAISLGMAHVVSAKRKGLVLEFVGYDDQAKWEHKGPSAVGIKRVRLSAFSDFVKNYFVIKTLLLNELNYAGDILSAPARVIDQRNRMLAEAPSDQDLFDYLSAANPEKNIETIIANIGRSWDPDEGRKEQIVSGLSVIFGYDLDRSTPATALIPCFYR